MVIFKSPPEPTPAVADLREPAARVMVCQNCGKPPKDCECIDQLRLGEGPAADLAFSNLTAPLDVVALDGGVTICLNRRSFGCEHLQDDGRLVVTIELSELESRTPTARALRKAIATACKWNEAVLARQGPFISDAAPTLTRTGFLDELSQANLARRISYEDLAGMLNDQIETDLDEFVEAAKATHMKFEGTPYKTWKALIEAVWSFDSTSKNLESLKENYGSKAVDLVRDLQRVTVLLGYFKLPRKDIETIVAFGAKKIAARQVIKPNYPITRKKLIGVLRYWRVSPEAVALEEQRKKTLGS